MAVKGTIRNFTGSGGSVSGYKAMGAGIEQGVRDPDTGKIYKHPRPVQDNGLKSGGSVKILNQNALSSRQARRNGTLGIGLVGDKTT